MNLFKCLALCCLAPLAATATEAPSGDALARWEADHTVVLDATDADPAAFHWLARPVVVFADTAVDPRFTQQMELLAARPGDLAVRDVVIITDTDPGGKSAARQKLRPRGFMLVLMAKDGTVMLRKASPWDVRELSRSIDKLPLRQQEMQDRRAPPVE